MTKPPTITIDGKKYELLPIKREVVNVDYVDHEVFVLHPIKPIDKPEKQKYSLGLWDRNNRDLYENDLDLTPQAAQALADAIKALVEHITGKRIDVSLIEASLKARELISKEEQV